MKLKPAKCVLFRKRVEFLGHIVMMLDGDHCPGPPDVQGIVQPVQTRKQANAERRPWKSKNWGWVNSLVSPPSQCSVGAQSPLTRSPCQPNPRSLVERPGVDLWVPQQVYLQEPKTVF